MKGYSWKHHRHRFVKIYKLAYIVLTFSSSMLAINNSLLAEQALMLQHDKFSNFRFRMRFISEGN